jgi:maltose/moltooligosaccharide transporter
MLLIPMVGVGIAWASILSMPYAMLASALPADKMGFYMGVFNFFIVLPQLIASLSMDKVVKHLLGGNALLAVVVGGGSMILAAILTLFLRDSSAKTAH